MAVLHGVLNLHHLDLEHASNHERDAGGNTGLVSIVDFGQYLTEFTITATEPEQLEDLAEILLDAAKHLRMARLSEWERRTILATEDVA